jgi:transcriptional regulator with XRE-family HTH domain
MGGAFTAGGETSRIGRDGRVRFGQLLADALRVREMKQEQLAGLLGTTQSSVSGWINAKYEPAATTVFRIEQALALEPGHLSRPLGYLPVDGVAPPVGLEGAILQSDDLEDDEKDVLVAVYRLLARRRPPAGKSVSTARGRLTSAHSVAGGR